MREFRPSVLVLVASLFALSVSAGRPVYENLNQADLIGRSEFIFVGKPTKEKSVGKCSPEMVRWQVEKIIKGDPSLKGKVLSIADHGYRLMSTKPEEKGASHAALRYGRGTFDQKKKPSVLFLNRKDGNCYELAAFGAQDFQVKEMEILINPPKPTPSPHSMFHVR